MEFKRKKLSSMGEYLYLEMNDKNGKEYIDGNILKVQHEEKEMIGFIRYSCGRF